MTAFVMKLATPLVIVVMIFLRHVALVSIITCIKLKTVAIWVNYHYYEVLLCLLDCIHDLAVIFQSGSLEKYLAA